MSMNLQDRDYLITLIVARLCGESQNKLDDVVAQARDLDVTDQETYVRSLILSGVTLGVEEMQLVASRQFFGMLSIVQEIIDRTSVLTQLCDDPEAVKIVRLLEAKSIDFAQAIEKICASVREHKMEQMFPGVDVNVVFGQTPVEDIPRQDLVAIGYAVTSRDEVYAVSWSRMQASENRHRMKCLCRNCRTEAYAPKGEKVATVLPGLVSQHGSIEDFFVRFAQYFITQQRQEFSRFQQGAVTTHTEEGWQVSDLAKDIIARASRGG